MKKFPILNNIKCFMEQKTKIMTKGSSISGLLILLFLLFPARSYAQETVDGDPEQPGIQQPVATVKIDGTNLFKIRGMSSFTSDQRAAAIGMRIRNAAADPSVSSDSVKIVPVNEYFSIYAGTVFIMNVYSSDADVEQVGIGTLTNIIQQRIAYGITLYRDNRSKGNLIKKSITAIASLAILTIILFLIIWLFKIIDKAFQKRMKAGVDTLENKSFSLIQATQLWKIYHKARSTLKTIIIILFIGFSINHILGLFPWTNNVATYILKLFVDPISSIGRGLLGFLPKLAFLIVIYLVTRYVLKLSKLLFAGVERGEIKIKNFYHDWAMPTYRIFKILVIAFAVVLAYPYIPGSSSSAFKGVSVFMGLLFSLGSSSFISNLIAGYTITYRRAFKTGDRIRVENHEGFVLEQKVLVTRLLTTKNEEIVIPNSLLLNSNIINYSAKARESGLIIHTVVGIGYETPWRQVESMLIEAAGRTEGLLKEPPPFVLQLLLGDFAIQYQINAYCNDGTRLEFYYTNLHRNIQDVFNENDVQIMTPAYMADPKIPKVVPEKMWDPPLARKK
jgi:small-conductance mechanosensitive channel